ncbi:Protein spt10 [Coniothyrium glycines]
MPAMLDDPTSPPILRAIDPSPAIAPRHVTLRNGARATILAFKSPAQPPGPVVSLLCSTLAAEVRSGDTYPMADALPLATFGPYWFGTFAAVMFLGTWGGAAEVEAAVGGAGGRGWEEVVLGSFYVKPNYPGRSSHVCNGGFLVAEEKRGLGVGGHLGRAYLAWAPRLGYEYSVFNLVYETNTASLRIWDSLGFERIGRVKKCGRLRSFPDRKIDAIVYGYDFEEAAKRAQEES